MENLENMFIDAFSLAARQAGAVARRLQGEVRLRQKGGSTPESAALTAVDLATQDVILLALRHALPDVAVDAEEDTETVALFESASPGRALVVIDPVDGTLNYSSGSTDYAVMGSLVADGVHRAAVVYFAQWGEMYWAVRGRGCRRAFDRDRPQAGGAGRPRAGGADGRAPGETVRVSSPSDLVLVAPNTSASVRKAIENAGFSVKISRCSAVDSCAPATGRAIAAVSMHRADRRRALGFLVTTEAGGTVQCAGREWKGEDVERGLEPPCIVAASPGVLERVSEAVASTGWRRG